MSSPLITTENLDLSKITIGQIEGKEYQKENPETGQIEKGNYKSIQYFYQQDGNKSAKADLEYPPMWIKTMILGKFGKDGLMLEFDLNDSVQKKHVWNLKKIHHETAELLYPQRGKAGLPDLMKGDLPSELEIRSMYEKTGFKGMFKFKTDDDSGEVIPGKNPTQFLEIYPWTKFIDINKKEIPYKKLKNFEFRAVPNVRLSYIYSSTGKASIQCKLQNVLVLEVRVKETLAKMNNAIEKYKADPNVNSNIDALLADVKEPDPFEKPDSKDSGKAPRLPQGRMEALEAPDPSKISATEFLDIPKI